MCFFKRSKMHTIALAGRYDHRKCSYEAGMQARNCCDSYGIAAITAVNFCDGVGYGIAAMVVNPYAQSAHAAAVVLV